VEWLEEEMHDANVVGSNPNGQKLAFFMRKNLWLAVGPPGIKKIAIF
jgi:hypothetical protein